MPRNGSGTYAPPSNTFNPATPDTTILSEDWNAILADLVLAMSQSIASDGQTVTSASIPFAQGLLIPNGLVTAPGLAIIGSPSTGFYSPAADQMAVAADGVQVALFTTIGLTLPLGLTIGDNASIAGNLTVGGNTTLGNANTDTLTVSATGTWTGPQTFSGALTFPNGSVSNAELADMATQTIKGRTTAGSGAPEDLTATQATAILNVVVGDSGSGGTKGLVPAPAAGDAAKKVYLDASGGYSNEIKAWGLFDGTNGNTLAARNMSCSRGSTGNYVITFGTALPNTNYAVFPCTSGKNDDTPYGPQIFNKTTTGFGMQIAYNNAGLPSFFDPDTLSIQVIA